MRPAVDVIEYQFNTLSGAWTGGKCLHCHKTLNTFKGVHLMDNLNGGVMLVCTACADTLSKIKISLPYPVKVTYDTRLYNLPDSLFKTFDGLSGWSGYKTDINFESVSVYMTLERAKREGLL